MKKNKILIIILGCLIFLSILTGVFFVLNKNKVYEVHFETDSETIIDIQFVKKGGKVLKPSDPEKTGYIFDKWYFENTEYDFNQPVTKDMVLVAQYLEDTNLEKFSVLFQTDEENVTIVEQIVKGDFAYIPETPTRDGYTFIEWQLNGVKYNFDVPVLENITLVAIWEENLSNQFTVTFNTNGGSFISSQTVQEGQTASKPNTPTKKGYTFVEWQLNGKKYNFNSKVTKNITLVAVWKANDTKNKYTVSFDSDGGTSITSQIITEGNKTIEPNMPTKSGYAFVEWQLNGVKYDFNSPVTKNINLKAVWTKNEIPIEVFTVTFNSDGGTTISSQNVLDGEKVTRPTNPSKDGYRFIEWMLDGTSYNFDSPITKNITLTAKWEVINKNKYTISFDTNGGSYIPNQTVEENGQVVKPIDPTRDGYKFDGWMLNNNIFDFSTKVTSDITLVAKWKEKTYKVKYVSIIKEGTSTITLGASDTICNYGVECTLRNPQNQQVNIGTYYYKGVGWTKTPYIDGNITHILNVTIAESAVDYPLSNYKIINSDESINTITLYCVFEKDYNPVLD